MLNYRTAVLCFAGMDFAMTLLKAIAVLASTRDSMWLALAVLTLGPLCGMLGARTLNHTLVSVYFAFCIFKAGVEIAFAIYTMWQWNVLFVVMQGWIIKMVATFMSTLNGISPLRRSELLELKDVAVHMVYW